MVEEQLPIFDINWDDLGDDDLLIAMDNSDHNVHETVTTEENSLRFPNVSNVNIDLILDGADSKATKYATNCQIKVFKEWASQRQISKELHDMENHELDKTLVKFYAEVRNRKGEEYSRSTLLGIRNSIERYLNNPPHKKGIKIAGNPIFQSSNKFLDAKIKQLKQQGKENVKHKPAIEADDMKKLKESEILKPSTPLGLLRNVWFNTTLYWCRRGREGQRSLTPNSFTFTKDAQGKMYATMTHSESTKNHPGGINDVESFEKDGRMYETNAEYDGYRALRFYIEKLNPNCTSFFQYPKRQGWKASDDTWYENRPLGVNKLANMMSEISQEACLSRRYTNHSLRATAITLWSEAGISNRHIMAISGHRNEESLRHYNARPSPFRLQQCSDVLSRALQSPGSEVVPYNSSTSHNSNVEQNNQLAVHSNHLNSFSGLFTSCNIENINISFKK